VNTVTASFHTIMEQMAEMSQQKKHWTTYQISIHHHISKTQSYLHLSSNSNWKLKVMALLL